MTLHTQAGTHLGKRLGLGLLRLLSCLTGLITAGAAVLLPLLFLANELQEADSAPRWSMDPVTISVLRVVSVVIALGFAALGGFIAYRLFQFALKRPELH
jgi:phage shock protein PspC (stress-responsive transcriptional regulator)